MPPISDSSNKDFASLPCCSSDRNSCQKGWANPPHMLTCLRTCSTTTPDSTGVSLLVNTTSGL